MNHAVRSRPPHRTPSRLRRSRRAAAALAAPAPDSGKPLCRAQRQSHGPHLDACHADHRPSTHAMALHHSCLPGAQPVPDHPVRRAGGPNSKQRPVLGVARFAPGQLRGCVASRAHRFRIANPGHVRHRGRESARPLRRTLQSGANFAGAGHPAAGGLSGLARRGWAAAAVGDGRQCPGLRGRILPAAHLPPRVRDRRAVG